MTLNASIGARIAHLRKINNLTQEQLAEKLDISIKHCSSVERGISRLSLEYLIELSNIFHVSLDYLIKGTSQDPINLENMFSIFPSSIISLLHSNDEQELQLFQEYLYLYSKIHDSKNK